MSNEMLSQEEIEALFDEDTNELSPMEKDALGEIGNIAFGSGSTALSILLNRRVELDTPAVDVANLRKLIQDYPRPCVAAEVDYIKGLKGANILLFQMTDAAVISDLMLGGDGLNPKMSLGEMELSAIGEALNQMIGKASTAMSSMFNLRVEIAPPRTSVLDLNDKMEVNRLFSEDRTIVRVQFRLVIEKLVDSRVMLVIPFDFAREMAHALLKNTDGYSLKSKNTGEEKIAASKKAAVSREIAPLQTEEAPSVVAHPTREEEPEQVTVQSVQFGPINQDSIYRGDNNLNLLLDVPLEVSVELGCTKMKIKEILDLGVGSVIELNRLAGEPVDVLVNDKLIAKGEVVVIDENFGVRISDIISPLERVNNLQ